VNKVFTTAGGAARSFAPVNHDRHVLERTIVLREHKLLFLPVPKAGCTSILWMLAELAGIEPEVFADSPRPEILASMTVHDANLWRPEHRLSRYTEEERAALLAEDGWLRFTVVRDPAPRLWSAWQSKLLVREPSFAETFGEEPWFPRVPESPEDILVDFGRFVAAIGDGATDVHWAVQNDLVARLPFDHVGRVEELGLTLARVREHVGDERFGEHARHENRSALPMPAGAFDAEGETVVRERFAPDYERFGYAFDPTAGLEPPAWDALAETALPVIQATIAHSERIGQLHRVAQRRNERLRRTTERLERITQKGDAARSPVRTNLEGEAEYDVQWAWQDGPQRPGFTAVLRVRDEARCLAHVLPPLLRAVDRIVLVDNGSTDGTPDVARALAEAEGAAGRLEVVAYPFSVARCGAEHLATPAHSVHSLVHFYNWSFSQARTSYVLKWDGDMVLTDRGVAALRDLAWQLEAAERVVKVPRMPLYVLDERTGFLDVGLHNVEPWGWPNRPGYRFVKAMDWELPLWGTANPGKVVLPDWCCVELKHLDADEFAHWSTTDFARSERQYRKQREWEVFRALRDGTTPPPDVHRIDAPDDVHVVDHVRETWLPAQAAAQPGSRLGALLGAGTGSTGASGRLSVRRGTEAGRTSVAA
jgi:hypothetical protein